MGSPMKMEAPVCLINNTSDGKLEANPEAIDILSRITQPVVVVSIVGLYRTGKSYLMNKLAGAQKGFNLGGSVQAETKGIWMWCVPHPRRLEHTLVLLDTEGLGDVEKGDTKNDIWIFSLAVLLSSALVYNSKGTIDQDALNKLRFVGELSDLIKVKSTDNDDEEAEFSEHFPIFIWAVRDFTLKLVIDGQVVTEDEYLENALKLKTPERTPKNEDYNKPRKYLRMYFGSRKCFVFDQPSADKEVLQKMEQVPESQFKPDFVAQSKKFCDYVFKNAEVKRVTGIPLVTGVRLAKLAKTYTEAISSSNVACMEEVVLSLSETENKAAVQDAIQYYESKMDESVVFPTETLDQFLYLSRRCENEAVQIFMKKSFKDKDQKFQNQLIELVQKKKDDLCRMNETKSRERCETLIKKLSAEFEEALAAGTYSVPGGHKQFMQDLDAIQEKYKTEMGKGVQADVVLKDYLMSKKSIGNNILKSDEALTENEKKMEEEKATRKIEEMKSQVLQLEESQRNQKKKDQMKTMEENMMQLIDKMVEERRLMKCQVERVIEEKNREMQRYRSQGSPHANMYQAQIEDLKEKNNKLKADQSDSCDFLPVIEAFKKVSCAIGPSIIEMAGDMIKKKVTEKWKKYQA
ncbi:guanylate-binding protein 1-like [Pseudophryne corroboree]|uniref:guanylate-binding protein 1-like n=1 Tax=Pseudophryne corroboree TaxID=495146 RepID=UPI003081D376